MQNLKNKNNVICPMVTPFENNGKINFSKIPQLLEYLYSGGIRQILVAGTTGEGMLLSQKERQKLAEAVIDYADNKFNIIVHTGCVSTTETIFLTEHAKSIGAYAASVITPYFFHYSQDELFEHYSKISKKVEEFPILLYAFPDNAGNKLSTNLVRRLIKTFPNFIGIKLSDINLIQFQEYIHVENHNNFAVYCGVDALMLPALAVGSSGQVSGNSNVFPEIFCDLVNEFHSGKIAEAQILQNKINHIRSFLLDNIAYFKAALSLIGLDVGQTRSPLRWLDNSEFQMLEKKLNDLSKFNEKGS